MGSLDVVTRLIVAAGYTAAATFVGIATSRVAPIVRPAYRFLTVTLAVWAGWYVTLGVLDLAPDPWGVLNRALHIPLVTSIVVAVWARRKAGQ